MAATRIVPYSKRWQSEANYLARSIVSIRVCVHCGHPVVEGYICSTCGSYDPQGTEEEREEFYKWVNKQHETD